MLPAPDSELVRDAIKSSYNFEFLRLAEDAREADLEKALLADVRAFLLEMGRGFALVGQQWRLQIPDEESGETQDFKIDLLFYNYILRRFVIVDLKIEPFTPKFVGQMQFYTTAIDELERQPGDKETIGLILCPSRNTTVAKWMLRGMTVPIGVATYDIGTMTIADEHPPRSNPPSPTCRRSRKASPPSSPTRRRPRLTTDHPPDPIPDSQPAGGRLNGRIRRPSWLKPVV